MGIASRPLETSFVPPASDNRVPVILVATANEDAGARHLRSLEFERRDILAALDEAQRGGICEIVSLSDATPEQVMRTFQHDSYRDRIAILHFAGHAGPEGLLFETSDGSTAVADAGGLAAFLGCQRGLQLVVLNACATQAHVDSLRDAGVGAVVATSRTVEDAIAHQFAVLFYQGLGSGAGIKRAYDEAVAGVRFKHGAVARGSTAESMHASAADATAAASTRAIVRKNAVTTDDGRWPWDLYFRPGAEETVAPWALPEAAGNPLFGLPTLPETEKPLTEPFRHLRPFGRAHAELFFGRGKDIRALYDKVTSATSESVVLLYGATGVGKSSLLDAGLLPRLTSTHEVRYAPRDRNLGLIGTLAQTLGVDVPAGQEATAVVDGWRALEARGGRPLFVVIDQVEEAYTGEDAGRAPPGAGARELDAFAAVVGRLFANPADRPRGRLVLGFRKEWLSEVKAALETHRVARTEHRLEQLTRSGVIEAINGPSRLSTRRMPTRLEIDPGLDILIADDLLAKRASHVAPLLQILLATMWTDAPKASDVVRFDAALYEAVQAKSKQLDQFLDEQLDALRAWNASAVDSGLVLDFLRFYTTPKATSDEHTLEEEATRYPDSNEVSPGLRAMCARLFLLVERFDDSGVPAPGNPARLAHDTLAPIVRERFDRSDLPGPRAKRVLDGRSAEWKEGKIGIPLDAQDLAVVEEGRSGMRAWNDEEKALVAASVVARDRARRRRAWVIRGAIAAVLTIAGFGVGSWLLYRQSQDRLAESTSRELSARALSTNGARRDVALLFSVAAFERAPTFEAHRAMLSQIGRDPTLIRVLPIFGSEIVFTPDGNRLATVTANGVQLYDIAAGIETPAPNQPRVFDRALFSFDGSGTAYTGIVKVDSAALEVTVGVWELETGKEIGLLRLPMKSVEERVEFTLSPQTRSGERFVSVIDGNDIVLWDLTTGKPVRRMRNPVPPGATFFSPDGSVLAAGSDASALVAWDVATGAMIKRVRVPPHRLSNVVISPDNSAMMTIADDTITMWWLRFDRAPRRIDGNGYSHARFLGDGSAIVVHASGGEVHVYDHPLDTSQALGTGEPSRRLYGVGDIPNDLIASTSQKRVASIYDNFVHIWDLVEPSTPGARRLVTATALPIVAGGEIKFLSPDGTLALERSGSRLTLWDVAAGRQVGDSVPFTEPDTLGNLSIPEPEIALGGSGRFVLAPKLEMGPQAVSQLYDARTPGRRYTLASAEHATPALEALGTRIAYGLLGTRSVVVENLAAAGAIDTLDPGPNPGVPLESMWSAAPAFSPRGDFLVMQPTVQHDTTKVMPQHLLVWDLAKRRVRDSLTGISLYSSQLYVSNDGGTIAAAQQFNRTVTFWRHGTTTPISTMRDEDIYAMFGSALSPDGRLFAFSTFTTVTLVDVSRGEAIAEITLGGGAAGTVAFVDEGRTLLVVGVNGRVQRITLDPVVWSEQACRIAASPEALRRFAEDAPAGVQVPVRCRAPGSR